MAVPIADRVEAAALIARLADGRIHSGAALARALGASRSALTHALERMRSLGVDIEELPRGFRLPVPVELLEPERIRQALDKACEARIQDLDVLFELDSTNTRLLAEPPPCAGSARVLLCELQSAGRGRRGRPWRAPFGGSLALSLGWTFADPARAVPALSLAVGVAIARALERQGARNIRLKWPNDVWLEDRKIGGVLVELKSEPRAAAYAVIGIGLNLRLSAATRRLIEQDGARVAALADAWPASPSGESAPVARNALAAALLAELLSMLAHFESAGFAPFRAEWLSRDALGGRPARVLGPEGAIEGLARGVDIDGALLLESGGRLLRFVSGEVSLRLREGNA